MGVINDMKQTIVRLLVVGFFVSTLVGTTRTVVYAQETADTTETEAVEATTLQATEVEATTDSAAGQSDKASGREARINAYKERVTTKLSDAKAKRTASRCTAAQEKIVTLRSRVQDAVDKRTSAYQMIGDKLDTLVAKLQEAGADTTAIETAREDVRTDLATLAESMAAYDTVLADLAAMDCASDPQTFMSALESARETQKKLREQAQEFRRFALNELRIAIQQTKAGLQAGASEEE